MRKIISFCFISLFLFTACSEDTDQERAQKKAVTEGYNILKSLGAMAQEGSSDQELQNSALDQIVNGLGKVVEGTKDELTAEEEKSLKDGAALLKNNAKAIKEEALKVLSQ